MPQAQPGEDVALAKVTSRGARRHGPRALGLLRAEPLQHEQVPAGQAIELVHYLDVEMVAQLCSTLGHPEPPELAQGAVGANGYDQGEFVEEELPDEG